MGARDFSEDGHASTYACESVWESCMQVIYLYVCSYSIHQWHLSLSVGQLNKRLGVCTEDI